MFTPIGSCKINELPDGLLEDILACMPIQDAVKTSILSRRWRNIWKKIPTLTFDDSFCTLMRSSERMIIEVIYQVLLLHEGHILDFSLQLSDLKSFSDLESGSDLESDLEVESCSEIHQISAILSNKGIKEFTFSNIYGDTYRFPSIIFSCEQLEHLSLYNCSFWPPAGFKGFSKLVSLELEDVSIDGQLFSSLIRNCPLLESLDFRSSTIYDCLELFAPNLKELVFYGRSKFLCFSDTPKLASIDLDIEFDIKYNLTYPNIEDNDIDSDIEDNHIDFDKEDNNCLLSGRLPRLDYLKLDADYAELMTANHAPTELATYLCNLKNLCLWYICFRTSSEVSSLISLIRNSPKLEKLQIHAYVDCKLRDSVSISEWDFTLHQLKEVELMSLSGSKCELQFIELLLENSPELEKIILELELEKFVGNKKFFKELSRLRHAFPLAEIVYKVHDCSDE